MERTRPPLDYLLTCSSAGLESFEMSRLNRIANLRRELRDVLDDWMEAEVNARVARWLLECKRSESRAAGAPPLLPPVSLLLGPQALPFLPPIPGADDSPSEQHGDAARPAGTPGEYPAGKTRGAAALPVRLTALPHNEQATGLRRLERRARRTAGTLGGPRLPDCQLRQDYAPSAALRGDELSPAGPATAAASGAPPALAARKQSSDTPGTLPCAPPAPRQTASLLPAPPIRARLQPALLRQRRLPPAS